jgi:hypothetical protein
MSQDGNPNGVSFGSVNILKHILFRFPKFLFLVPIYFVIYLGGVPFLFTNLISAFVFGQWPADVSKNLYVK